MEGSVINQICASMDSFFDTEKKIGDYIVRNPKEVVDMTVGELAKECGVSEGLGVEILQTNRAEGISPSQDIAGERTRGCQG